jgi:hypothetical protein
MLKKLGNGLKQLENLPGFENLEGFCCKINNFNPRPKLVSI